MTNKVAATISPMWFIDGGRKLKHDPQEPPQQFVLRSKFAEIIVYPDKEAGWDIRYNVEHADGGTSSGRVFMSSKELRQAFGFEGGPDATVNGKFIRSGLYVNIPCQGTGFEGDPNISLMLDEPLKAALKKFANR